MARLYSNENFPLPAVARLRDLGHDVLTIQESGKANQRFADDAVLSFALNEKRAVLTINRKHFAKLHRSNPTHAGIIVCTYDSDFMALAQRIHDAIGKVEGLDRQLIRVNRPAR